MRLGLDLQLHASEAFRGVDPVKGAPCKTMLTPPRRAAKAHAVAGSIPAPTLSLRGFENILIIQSKKNRDTMAPVRSHRTDTHI